MKMVFCSKLRRAQERFSDSDLINRELKSLVHQGIFDIPFDIGLLSLKNDQEQVSVCCDVFKSRFMRSIQFKCAGNIRATAGTEGIQKLCL